MINITKINIIKYSCNKGSSSITLYDRGHIQMLLVSGVIFFSLLMSTQPICVFIKTRLQDYSMAKTHRYKRDPADKLSSCVLYLLCIE
jgi:hypothetical protein